MAGSVVGKAIPFMKYAPRHFAPSPDWGKMRDRFFPDGLSRKASTFQAILALWAKILSKVMKYSG